jgi:hypothetical protein
MLIATMPSYIYHLGEAQARRDYDGMPDCACSYFKTHMRIFSGYKRTEKDLITGISIALICSAVFSLFL